MQYKELAFDGDTEHWFSEIFDGDDHLLLHPANDIEPADLPKSSHRQLGLYTSATTGTPKCIWNSLDKLKDNARITAREFGISSDDRLLMMAKPWHIAGLSWALMAESAGAGYTFIPTKSGELERWYNNIRKVRPTHLLTVPAVLHSLFSYPDWFVPHIVFGGAPLNYESYKMLKKHSSEPYQAYGQTEAGGLISCHAINIDREIDKRSCHCYGYPPKEFDLRCEGSPEDPQPILLRSPTATHGKVYDTGDQGYFDNKGRIYLVGRGDKN